MASYDFQDFPKKQITKNYDCNILKTSAWIRLRRQAGNNHSRKITKNYNYNILKISDFLKYYLPILEGLFYLLEKITKNIVKSVKPSLREKKLYIGVKPGFCQIFSDSRENPWYHWKVNH